jgi:hypothetical protein
MSDNEDDDALWPDESEFFKHQGIVDRTHGYTHYRSLTSGVIVQDLLRADRDWLLWFIVVSTYDALEWCYGLNNMNGLVPGTDAYVRQGDANRVVHRMHAYKLLQSHTNDGSHCGDCISVSCSCDVCGAERDALAAKYWRAKGLSATGGDSVTAVAVLLHDDLERMRKYAARRTAVGALDAAGTKARAVDAAVFNARYPLDLCVSWRRSWARWQAATEDVRAQAMVRARRMQAWCASDDALPVCPGVPWW